MVIERRKCKGDAAKETMRIKDMPIAARILKSAGPVVKLGFLRQ